MNHPFIANENGKARHNELLKEAANHRLQTKAAQQNSKSSLLKSLMSLFL
ncbi:MAG: hypothetical protein H6658_14730 [Ardenticatenaceae bacterium]|nr:hypothetical protein [Ardenticatenaceae bacterium]